MSTVAPEDVARLAGYFITHVKSGHTDPAHPKYPKYVKDLGTLIVDARRVLYRIQPPATQHEQLSYLVSTVSHLADVLDDEPALRKALASIEAADTTVRSIDTPEGAPV